jgi:hypothetical protein
MYEVRCLFRPEVWSIMSMKYCTAQTELMTHGDTIEQVVIIGLVLLEDPNVLEYLLVDRNTLVVPNGVFTKEVEDDVVRLLEGDVLTAEGATTDGVRLVFALLVTCTKRKLVDKVHRRGTLTVSHDLVLEIRVVVLTNAVDMFLHGRSAIEVDRCIISYTLSSRAFSNLAMSL